MGAGRHAVTPAAAPRIGVLALGEAHQLLHVLAPALGLARRGANVDLLVTTDWHEAVIARHAAEARPAIRRLNGWRGGGPISAAPNRVGVLLSNLARLRGYDALLTAERTSTLLRRLRLFQGLLAIVAHGAGDREVTFDPRYRHFDLVLAPGKKARETLVTCGLVDPAQCIVTGYGKFEVISAAPPPRFFDNDRPVVLYNPHFRKALSSWPNLGPQIVEAFAETGDFNLIVAPHIRAAGKMRRQIEELARGPLPGNIRVDPGSLHSINMDYTRAADIYLGDVSSQVYEFLRTPRPCVFLNPRRIDWAGDPHYRHWNYGCVAETAAEAMTAIRTAHADHPHYAPAQREGFAESVADGDGRAADRAAEAILARLEGRLRA